MKRTYKKYKLLTLLIFFVMSVFVSYSNVDIKTCKDCVLGQLNYGVRSGGVHIVGECNQQFQMIQPRFGEVDTWSLYGRTVYGGEYYNILMEKLKENNGKVCENIDFVCNNRRIVLKGCAEINKTDEEGNLVILRNPKLAVAYYIEPYLALKYNIFVMQNLAEIEDFLFYYLRYPLESRPVVYFRWAFPIELLGYLSKKNGDTENLDPYLNIYTPILSNIVVPFFESPDSYYGVVSLTDYLHYFNDTDMYINASNFPNVKPFLITEKYSKDENGQNPSKVYLGSVILPVSFEYEYQGQQYKIDDSAPYFILTFPKGLVITFIDEPTCNRVISPGTGDLPVHSTSAWLNYRAVIDLVRTYAEHKIKDALMLDVSPGIAESYEILPQSAIEQAKNIKGCVYYYRDKLLGDLNDKKVYLYTGKLVTDNTYFVPVDNYYYLEGNTLKKFNKKEVYLCKNGNWIDLDENEEECINFMNKFYGVYNSVAPVYKDGECLINEIDEHKVWFREYKGDNEVEEDLNNFVDNKEYVGFSACVNSQGDLISNGEIDEITNKTCSFGILTPVFDEIKKFYIKDFPENITFVFNLSNFASEPIELESYEIEGVPETWSYKVYMENTTVPAESNFSLEVTLFNFEEDGSQKNITIKLTFKLKDNVTNLLIPVEIPIRLQFTKEYLVQAKMDDEIIFDETKGKTNDITLRLKYDTYGALERVNWCNENEVIQGKTSGICKYVLVNFTLPQGCNEVFPPENIQYLSNTGELLTPYIEFNCNRPITDHDKVIVCSKTVIIEGNQYYDLYTGSNSPDNTYPNNKAHCNEISLKATSYIKDFVLTTSQKREEDNYYLFVNIENIGNKELIGVNINVTDKTGNCGLSCGNNQNCNVVGNTLIYVNPTEEIPVGSTLTKVFKVAPTGICELYVNVIIDDPIQKNTTVIINPYLEKGYSKTIVKGNPTLYPYFVLLVALIFFLVGVYKIREEFD